MSLLVKRTLMLIKTEASEASAASPAATDALLAEEITWSPVVEKLNRNASKSSIGQLAELTGMRHLEVEFKTPIQGGGTAGTAYAALSALFQACALAETLSAGVSATYAPTSAKASGFESPGKSCTIEIYNDGMKYTLVGCRGSLSGSGTAGKHGYHTFKMKGLYAAAADAALPTFTPPTTEPPSLLSAAATLQGYAAIFSKWEFDLQNDVQIRPSVNAATGIAGFAIVGRNVVGSADPEAVLVATHDFWGKLISGVRASSVIAFGATAGNITTITTPKTMYRELKPGERNGIRTFEIGLQFAENSGDDEISIVLT
jgi:hypothetical protein